MEELQCHSYSDHLVAMLTKVEEKVRKTRHTSFILTVNHVTTLRTKVFFQVISSHAVNVVVQLEVVL